MRNALRAKKKLGFIDGSLEKPSNDSSEIEDWWMVNSMLVAWIFNTIEPTLRSTITYVENVKDLWEDIQQRFSIGNGPRVHQLKTDIAACKQQGQAVMTYYGRLKMMWDELANYEPIPVCRCGHCTCNVSAEIERIREEERIHQFLMGLDDVMYGTLRTNLLSMEPLPNLNRVYSTVIQEERHRNIARSKEGHGDIVGFTAQAVLGAKAAIVRAKDNKTGICRSCGRPGHDAKECFQIIGYPEWWGDRPRGTGKSGHRGRGGTNAISTSRGRGGARANVTRAATGEASSAADVDHNGIPGLSDEQWAKLLEMLSAANTSEVERLSGNPNLSLTNWIVDSGASHHMTGDVRLLSDVRDIAPCPVKLPNGKHTMAVK
ncbi:hypothetical protein F511_08213 [Dorcoceras hygrometricum]|uniref:CCHC-type domain-containing protein n=1 Tax=Dorcoceras hygrometricum TaxID=472368 RepID=A0A2Z7BYS3_9LAMI|nr:hypothetical protein F511_08213 [Dorcoceras hygrometricum]